MALRRCAACRSWLVSKVGMMTDDTGRFSTGDVAWNESEPLKKKQRERDNGRRKKAADRRG